MSSIIYRGKFTEDLYLNIIRCFFGVISPSETLGENKGRPDLKNEEKPSLKKLEHPKTLGFIGPKGFEHKVPS